MLCPPALSALSPLCCSSRHIIWSMDTCAVLMGQPVSAVPPRRRGTDDSRAAVRSAGVPHLLNRIRAMERVLAQGAGHVSRRREPAARLSAGSPTPAALRTVAARRVRLSDVHSEDHAPIGRGLPIVRQGASIFSSSPCPRLIVVLAVIARRLARAGHHRFHAPALPVTSRPVSNVAIRVLFSAPRPIRG